MKAADIKVGQEVLLLNGRGEHCTGIVVHRVEAHAFLGQQCRVRLGDGSRRVSYWSPEHVLAVDGHVLVEACAAGHEPGRVDGTCEDCRFAAQLAAHEAAHKAYRAAKRARRAR